MTHVAREIVDQPECWRRAGALAAGTKVKTILPLREERVAVVGAGTSWFMAMAYAHLREAGGHGITDAFAASEFPTSRNYDRVVAITRSGTTTEVLDLLSALPAGTPSTAITAVEASPVVTLATDTVVLPFADELAVVQTRFATTALALLRAHLGQDLNKVASDAVDALGARIPVGPSEVEHVTFLGSGWTIGLALEAALKCREAARLFAEAYPAMDYRHGPIAMAEPGRLIWALGELPAGLAGDIGRTGATLFHMPGCDPMAVLVLAQRFAVEAALARGLDPDAPRHLTRSVVLR
jgi:fructoselysine-6-P-deglycase FrlB-like protein